MLLYCKYHFPNLLLCYFQFPASFYSNKDKLSVFIFKAHQDYFYLILLLQSQEVDSGFDQHMMPTSIVWSLNFQTTLNIFSSAASHVLVDFFINRSVHYLPSIFFLKVLCTVKLQAIQLDNSYIAGILMPMHITVVLCHCTCCHNPSVASLCRI